jgi:hypothetical protein
MKIEIFLKNIRRYDRFNFCYRWLDIAAVLRTLHLVVLVLLFNKRMEGILKAFSAEKM